MKRTKQSLRLGRKNHPEVEVVRAGGDPPQSPSSTWLKGRSGDVRESLGTPTDCRRPGLGDEASYRRRSPQCLCSGVLVSITGHPPPRSNGRGLAAIPVRKTVYSLRRPAGDSAPNRLPLPLYPPDPHGPPPRSRSSAPRHSTTPLALRSRPRTRRSAHTRRTFT